MATATELWLVVQPAQGDAHEVVVESASDAKVGDLSAALGEHVGWTGSGGPGLFSRRLQAWLHPETTVAASRLSTGDSVVLGQEGDTSDWSPQASRHLKLDLVELVVAAGPSSGARLGLPYGEYVLGRDPDGQIVVDDPSLSRNHVRIRVDESAVKVSDAGSTNGTAVEGVLLGPTEERVIRDGEVVEAGRSVFAFRRGGAPHGPSVSGVIVAQQGGRVPFNRPPRIERPFEPLVVDLGAPPGDAQKGRLPLVASMLPLVIGVVLWQTTGNVTMLLFAALAPVMAGWTFFEGWRGGKNRFRQGAADFRLRAAQAAAELREAHRRERDARRRGAPTAVELVDRATEYRSSLWERRPDDNDFLSLRVGTGTQPTLSHVRVDEHGSGALRSEAEAQFEPYATLSSLPVTVSLKQLGSLGISGGRDRTSPLARWLLVQAAALHSPRDLVIAAAVPDESLDEWSWLKWLPHTHSEVSPIEGPHLATTPADVRRLLEEIRGIAQERRAAAERGGAGMRTSLPWILLLVDERVSPERALLTEILSSSQQLGIVAVWVGARARDIPGECGAIAELAPETAALALTIAESGERVEDVTADGVPEGVASEVALALAPVRDTSAGRGRGQVPRRVSLLDLTEIEPDPTTIAAVWKRAEGLGATIGATDEGPLAIDLRLDGPHALVAGTTGAGKSELLQTIVASLAAAHPPTRVTFLLVDYKGGAAFKECVSLPHTVGFVTDLDEHLTNRALVSLNAELRRREEILRQADAKDLADMEERGQDGAPPSLVIVIDEFATLAKEVPDFVAGVVDVAQRGRSLGVHLMLATQRPGGVVSDNIRANTNLRIALRVNDQSESSDVIDNPQAARIARGLPGRGFIRTGHGELTEFQTAYVGGVSGAKGEASAVSVRPLAFDARSSTQERVLPPTDERRANDLVRLVAACREAAANLALPRPVTPWLAALAETLPLDTLPKSTSTAAVVGLVDEPSHQLQRPYVLDFDASGSVLVFGASGSGKTTLLRTTACALATAASPNDLHLYGLDFASRGLMPVEALPHCGGVVPGEDEERVTRLFSILRKELSRRKDAFGRAGVSSLEDYGQRAEGSFPRIVVLLDDYGGFASAYERVNLGELLDVLPRLVAEGRPLGIHFVITADRRGSVPGSIVGIVPQKIVLRMAGDDDYASLGLDLKAVRGAHLPAGRAFVDGTLEMQLAVAGPTADAAGQAAALAELGARIPDATAGGPLQVRILPALVSASELPPPDRALRATLGLGDDELAPAIVDLAEAHFLITGPYRSGRSTALAAIASSVGGNPERWLLAPRRSPLRELNGWARVATSPEECEVLAQEAVARASVGGSPLIIVVDDADQLADGLVSTSLETIVRQGRDTEVRVVAAGETQAVARAFSGWLRELRKDEHGLLLNAQPDIDGDILGVRLPRRSVAGLPGRGYLVNRGVVELVQVVGA